MKFSPTEKQELILTLVKRKEKKENSEATLGFLNIYGLLYLESIPLCTA